MLYLASRSPRRKELLEQLRVQFKVLEISIDETRDGEENPGDFVVNLALEKARTGKKLVQKGDCVLGSDTEVVLDGRILGKPIDKEHAVNMLGQLSGRTHYVFSAVAVVHDTERTALNISRVSFKLLTPEECRNYCRRGESLDKAGAYAIQGRAAAFITRLDGSYSGVMGLPLIETAELLNKIIEV